MMAKKSILACYESQGVSTNKRFLQIPRRKYHPKLYSQKDLSLRIRIAKRKSALRVSMSLVIEIPENVVSQEKQASVCALERQNRICYGCLTLLLRVKEESEKPFKTLY